MSVEARREFLHQFEGDKRFHTKDFTGSDESPSAYFATLSARESATIITWNSNGAAVPLRVGTSGATAEAYTCAIAILYGEEGSSHWVFGHLDSTYRFPRGGSALVDASKGIAGTARLLLFGEAPMSEHDDVSKDRKKHVDVLHEQIMDCHVSLLRENIRPFWNNDYQSYLNMVATVDQFGLSNAHVMLVPVNWH